MLYLSGFTFLVANPKASWGMGNNDLDVDEVDVSRDTSEGGRTNNVLAGQFSRHFRSRRTAALELDKL